MSTIDTPQWPPPYRVRKSKRAQHLQLKISPEHGLEVVVPAHLETIDPEPFLHQHRQWILTRINKMPQPMILPPALALRCINQNWQIQTIKTQNKLKLLANRDFTLSLIGNIDDEQHSQRLLNRWLHKAAKQHLIPQLKTVSMTIGIPFNDATIRNQKTRWGSCSPEHNITLNQKLLFLPTHLTRYIMIHELCHTHHLDHSKRFWRLVERFDPNYIQHRDALNHWSQMNIWGVIAEPLLNT